MISHRLLVALLVLSCVANATCNHDNITILTYPVRVVSTTTQGECPSDAQREMVRAEVKDEIRNLLHQVGKLVWGMQ